MLKAEWVNDYFPQLFGNVLLSQKVCFLSLKEGGMINCESFHQPSRLKVLTKKPPGQRLHPLGRDPPAGCISFMKLKSEALEINEWIPRNQKANPKKQWANNYKSNIQSQNNLRGHFKIMYSKLKTWNSKLRCYPNKHVLMNWPGSCRCPSAPRWAPPPSPSPPTWSRLQGSRRQGSGPKQRSSGWGGFPILPEV